MHLVTPDAAAEGRRTDYVALCGDIILLADVNDKGFKDCQDCQDAAIRRFIPDQRSKDNTR